MSFDVGLGFDFPVENLKVQANGDILVRGNFDSFDGHARPSLARLNSDGSLDEDFEIRGISMESQIASATYTADSGLLLAGGWMSFEDFLGRGLVLLEPAPEPVIKSGPIQSPAAEAGGAGIILSADAVGNGVLTYQWQAQYIDGGFIDIPGANSATLSIPSPQRFHSGSYRVMVSANGIAVASTPVAVTVEAAAPSSDARLVNLSTRAQVQPGDNVLISGFTIAGSANKRLLIRAAGPTLNNPPIDLGGGVLPDPLMTLKKFNPALSPHGGFEDYASNDNGATNANAADIERVSAQLGAFALTHANDAALLIDLAPGRYTVVTGDAAVRSGVAIVELYDADAAGGDSRLVNISSRGFAGAGGKVMIPGFVVSNEGPRTLLIRAVGPALADPEFGVQGAMADPTLTVFRADGGGASTRILSQDNWGENPDAACTAQIARQAGAFDLAADSADAAFVVTLPPGVYTMHGQSADGVETGVVLVEVYDVVSP
ncbi:MAG: hypothetical protein ACREIA_06960 [Opitutaceae bacterium]